VGSGGTHLSFELLGGHGVSAIPSINEVNVIAVANALDITGHHRIFGFMEAIEQVALPVFPLQLGPDLLDFLGRAVDDHPQHVIGLPEIGVNPHRVQIMPRGEVLREMLPSKHAIRYYDLQVSKSPAERESRMESFFVPDTLPVEQ
jgi:hypothetical protein